MTKIETRIAAKAIGIIIAIIVLTLLASCKTKTFVETEVVTVHDTVVSVRTDTIRDIKVHTIHDTLMQKEVHTYNINNVGDTIKEIHHYHDSEKVIVVDSTDRYKATVDSLQKALTEEKAKVKISVKDHIPKWVWIVSIINLFFLFLFFGRFLLPLLKKQRE